MKMKPKLQKGRYLRTDKNGSDYYSADYYIPSEVKMYIKQSKKIRKALKELISIVEIHSKATNNNFAWAELDSAKEAVEVSYV